MVYANQILAQQGPDLSPGQNRLLRRIARQCRAAAILADMVMQLPEPEGYSMYKHRFTWEQQLDAWTKVPPMPNFRGSRAYSYTEPCHRMAYFIYERKLQIARMHRALGHEQSQD